MKSYRVIFRDGDSRYVDFYDALSPGEARRQAEGDLRREGYRTMIVESVAEQADDLDLAFRPGGAYAKTPRT